RLVIVERIEVGTVRGVNRQATPAGDVADDPVARPRPAAFGQVHHEVVDALDLDALILAPRGTAFRLGLVLPFRSGGNGLAVSLVKTEPVGRMDGGNPSVPDGRYVLVEAGKD